MGTRRPVSQYIIDSGCASWSDWKQKKKKRSLTVGFQSYRSLADVAVRCLCELLLSMAHFNFHNNIIVALVPLMNDPAKKVSAHSCSMYSGGGAQVKLMSSCVLLQVSGVCCDAFRKLFHQDKVGVASLAAVRVISGLTKSLNYNVRPEVRCPV